MSFGPGVRLGPYEIVSPAGAGGMGEVYRARDTRLDRTVAIKVLPPDLTNDPAARQRLEREARAVAALSHPHICTLHDIGHQHETDFLVMEFLDGETLAARLARAKLPLDQALHYGIQIADALAAAHKAGIVHRDLKPGNVMLTKSGAKLLDFGLAKPREQALVTGQTATAWSEPLTGYGTILGTLQYMAPEQLEGKEADARSDIFALGALTYEMVTGRRAFDAGTQPSTIAKILEMNPPAPSTLAPVCPPALDRLIQRCLAKESDNRWQSARDVLLELQWIAADQARGAAAAPRGSRRTAWLPWSVAAVAVVGAIAAWAWRPSPAERLQPAARFDIPLPSGMLPQTEWLGPPVLSPDGRYVVMAASKEGSIQLHLRSLDGTSFTPIPGTEDGRSPFWSPDSRSIAFFTAGRLQRIDVSGGPPRVLCEVDGLAYGGSWSPRGDILFAIDSLRAAGTTPGIRHVRDTGGTPAQVTTLDRSQGETGHRSPQFLPDGERFVFTALGHRTEIRSGSLRNRTTKLLVTDAMLPAFVPPGTLLFLRQESVLAVPFDPQRLEVDGTERVIINQGVGGFSAAADTIAFSPAGAVLRKLQWVLRDGRRTAAAGEPGPYGSLSLSPSGRRVALQRREVTGTSSGADIWVLEFATGVLSRVTSDQDFEGDPSWSPDEKSLAFSARRQGSWQILRKDLTTGTKHPSGRSLSWATSTSGHQTDGS